jgi:putative aldouronate transport system substrate-binding protein
LGIAIPETIDEWYQALTAIKNEFNPSIVLSLPAQGVNSNFGTFISAYGIAPDFYQADGIAMYGRIQDGYLEFLQTMNKWYAEGLIDTEFATRDAQSLNALIDSGEMTAVHQQSPSFINAKKQFGQLWTGTPYPTLEKGTPNPWRFSNNVSRGNYTLISATNKHPDESIKWLDYGYSLEGMQLMNFGVDGQDYNGLTEKGYPNYIEDYVTADGNAAEWTNRRSVFRVHNGTYLKSDSRSNPNRWIDELEQWRVVWGSTPSPYSLPPVTMTVDESAELSSIMTDIKTYVNEMTVKFIMGAEPLSEYENYISTIQGMNIDKAIAIYQAALDRYVK